MSQLDLIIRNATIVTHEGVRPGHLGVADGKIVSFEPEGKSLAEIDASGLHVFPGMIDAHVHFNEPGRADWEGFGTGTRALAAGGGTLFFDMPLNAHPPTCDAASFGLKLAAAQTKCITDFAFWGGLVPGNLDRLAELAARGVVGFKAFMSNSGIDDFSSVDDATLRAGMKLAASLHRPVAVHAESETLTSRLAAERVAAGKISIRDYLESRPVVAELEAIERALNLAGETGCALHVVHVSSGQGVAMIAAAKRAGVDVTCETCPHYLTLTDADMENIGAAAKCAPPLRNAEVQADLWRELQAEAVNTVGSDHSPSPPEMKQTANFFKVWGGISGVQHTLPLLLTEGHFHRGVALSQITKLLSFNVAERFHLPKTLGRIELGAEANLALVDLSWSGQVNRHDLLTRHPISPYVGRTLTGRVVQTILRGKNIYKDGHIIGHRRGQLIKPI